MSFSYITNKFLYNLTNCPLLCSHYFPSLSLCPPLSNIFSLLVVSLIFSCQLERAFWLKMSRKASKRVGLSPDVDDKPTVFLKHGSGTRAAGNRIRVARFLCFRLPRSSKYSPVRLFSRLGAKVASVLRQVSMRKSSRKVSSSSTLTRSRSLADAIDSQRAEAIEDCIEFLNSSSSYLERSNSVSANSC